MWASDKHTGEPVPIWAYGPPAAAQRFAGVLDYLARVEQNPQTKAWEVKPSLAQSWDFAPLDDLAFPAVRLAREVGKAGGTYPAVYNAANEVCVDAFHSGAIGFLDIVDTVARVVDAYAGSGSTAPPLSVEQVLQADAWARRTAAVLVGARPHDTSPAREQDET